MCVRVIKQLTNPWCDVKCVCILGLRFRMAEPFISALRPNVSKFYLYFLWNENEFSEFSRVECW